MEEAEFHAAALRSSNMRPFTATTVSMFPQQTCVKPQKKGDLSHKPCGLIHQENCELTNKYHDLTNKKGDLTNKNVWFNWQILWCNGNMGDNGKNMGLGYFWVI